MDFHPIDLRKKHHLSEVKQWLEKQLRFAYDREETRVIVCALITLKIIRVPAELGSYLHTTKSLPPNRKEYPLIQVAVDDLGKTKSDELQQMLREAADVHSTLGSLVTFDVIQYILCPYLYKDFSWYSCREYGHHENHQEFKWVCLLYYEESDTTTVQTAQLTQQNIQMYGFDIRFTELQKEEPPIMFSIAFVHADFNHENERELVFFDTKWRPFVDFQAHPQLQKELDNELCESDDE
jgi:hypothetical protein